MPINCAVLPLDPFQADIDGAWNMQRAMHLSRRMGMGSSLPELNTMLSMDPVQLVNTIVDNAIAEPLNSEPEWASWSLSQYPEDEEERNAMVVEQIFGLATSWITDIKNKGLRDRMSWFWHNHFVTRLEDYGCPSWMWQYHRLLQQYAVGNFKDFVHAIGTTPAMLVFLNNIQNTRFNPNENYARELFELFTMGVDNGYTQDDIVDTARAITGWNDTDFNDLCGTISFNNLTWDPAEKTIFGQTGDWGYDDVIDILFEQRAAAISRYICGKLYRHFVNPQEDEAVIEVLAEVFRNNNFEIAPVLRAMFSSAHFFDEAHIGTVIPGHIELFLTFINELGFPDDETLMFTLAYSADEYDQRIFNPTDVSGWPGNRNWITSASLLFRWEGITNIMAYYFSIAGETLEPLRDFVKDLVGDSETDPAMISRAIIDHMLPKPLQFEEEYDEALRVFKSEIPDNYFEGQWNLDWEYVPAQVFYLLNHLSQLPEFQLR